MGSPLPVAGPRMMRGSRRAKALLAHTRPLNPEPRTHQHSDPLPHSHHPIPTGMFSFLFSPIDVDGKDGGRDERAPSPTPLLEDGHASGPNSSSSSSSSSKVVLRSAAAMFTIADSETRTEASVAGREGKEDSGPVRKGKEPLLESVLNELNGDGKGLSALSPHRLMQVAKTIVLCCAYMAIGAWRWWNGGFD